MYSLSATQVLIAIAALSFTSLALLRLRQLRLRKLSAQATLLRSRAK